MHLAKGRRRAQEPEVTTPPRGRALKAQRFRADAKRAICRSEEATVTISSGYASEGGRLTGVFSLARRGQNRANGGAATLGAFGAGPWDVGRENDCSGVGLAKGCLPLGRFRGTRGRAKHEVGFGRPVAAPCNEVHVGTPLAVFSLRGAEVELSQAICFGVA